MNRSKRLETEGQDGQEGQRGRGRAHTGATTRQPPVARSDDAPSLVEFVAVAAALEAYGKKMHPRRRRYVEQILEQLDELEQSIARVRHVTKVGDAGGAK